MSRTPIPIPLLKAPRDGGSGNSLRQCVSNPPRASHGVHVTLWLRELNGASVHARIFVAEEIHCVPELKFMTPDPDSVGHEALCR